MFEGVRVLTLPLREVPGVAYLFARQAIGLMAEVGVHVELVHLSVVEELAEGRIGQALLALPRRAAVTQEGRAGRQEPEDVDRIVVLASEFVHGSLRDLFPLVVLGHPKAGHTSSDQGCYPLASASRRTGGRPRTSRRPVDRVDEWRGRQRLCHRNACGWRHRGLRDPRPES
jgi:hypothetical protein